MKQITTWPNPILRKKSKTVRVFDRQLKNLAESMIKIMKESSGIGLAAVQIGDARRVFVAQNDHQAVKSQEPRHEIYNQKVSLMVVVNPKIISKSKNFLTLEEGCLSIPGQAVDVTRSRSILIQGFSLKGYPIKLKLAGLAARIVQHELDHLNGKLIIDYGSARQV